RDNLYTSCRQTTYGILCRRTHRSIDALKTRPLCTAFERRNQPRRPAGASITQILRPLRPRSYTFSCCCATRGRRRETLSVVWFSAAIVNNARVSADSSTF
ncbi:unnamed protein product, partial [Ectocarpus sp. 6 AP-2014]